VLRIRVADGRRSGQFNREREFGFASLKKAHIESTGGEQVSKEKLEFLMLNAD